MHILAMFSFYVGEGGGVHACYDTGPYQFEAVKQKQPKFEFVYVAIRAGVKRLRVNLFNTDRCKIVMKFSVDYYYFLPFSRLCLL